MHVTLIRPPHMISASNATSTVTMPPLGVAYLAGAVEGDGYTVTVIDAVGEALGRYRPFRGPTHIHGLEDQEIIDRIPEDTDAIGVGLMFSANWPLHRELLRKIKDAFPDTPLIVGGEHATGLPWLTLHQAPVDAVVLGEGEETFVHALSNLDRLDEVPGLALPHGLTPTRHRIRQVDNLPWPAWKYFDIEGYIAFNQPHGMSRGRFLPMLATRGCPYKCAFCSSPGMWTQRWIPRSPVAVVDEIAYYVQQYRVEDIQFEDMTAIVRVDWVMDFCLELQRRGVRITWQLPCGTRSEAMDRQLAEVLYENGCRLFSYAPESGSTRILKLIHKQVDLENLLTSASAAIGAGVHVGGLFILGFPQETWRDMLATCWLIARMAWRGAGHVNIGAFFPLPNTELYHELVQEKRLPEELQLPDDYFHHLFGHLDLRQITSWNPRLRDWQLRMLITCAHLLFVTVACIRHPRRFVSLVRDAFRAQSETQLGKYMRTMRKVAGALRRSGTR